MAAIVGSYGRVVPVMRRLQRGVALALVLWLLAGMALTAAAMINLSRANLVAMEFYLRQTQAEALGRGASLLVLREQRLANQQPSAPNAEQNPDAPFVRRYVFGEIVVSARIRSGTGLVSLNTAEESTLRALFTGLAGLDNSEVSRAIDAIQAYRQSVFTESTTAIDHIGFRYREELLVQSGMTLDGYDKIKQFVHTFDTGDVDVDDADPTLSGVLGQADPETGPYRSVSRAGAGRSSGVSKPSSGLTFDSIYAQRAKGGAADINLVEVSVGYPDGQSFRQLVWVEGDGVTILRARPAEVMRSNR